MVLLASAGLPLPMPSWPRMHSGQKNPFQNAPGPFIYALPNLAGTCPFSYSDIALFCPFTADPNAPDQHYHHRCCHSPAITSRCCGQDPSSESAELPTAPTKEGAPDMELPLSPRPPAPLPPSDEIHFDLDVSISSSSLTERVTEPDEHQEEEASEPSTPTQSIALSSPMGSNFAETNASENKKAEGDEEGKGKRVGRRKRHRKRAKGRPLPEHCGITRGPRAMGLSLIHYNLLTQYAQYVYPQAHPPPLLSWPPPAAATIHHHHAWLVPNKPARQFWDPMAHGVVPAVPGSVGMPMSSW